MKNKLSVLILIMFLSSNLYGCWNYKGLDEISIVAGIAVDRDKKTGNILLTYELVDLREPVKGSKIKAEISQSEGKSIFDAIRNAKRRMERKLYFGNTQVFIISRHIAENEGLKPIIDLLFRDQEFRETINLIINYEDEAKDLLLINEKDDNVKSYQIQNIIKDDQKVTDSTCDVQLYQIYNILHGKGKESLVLPAFHVVSNNSNKVAEANGLAVFKKDRVIGFLNPQQSKDFLYATNNVKGGLLAFNSSKEKKQSLTLEVQQNKTKISFKSKGKDIEILINIKTNAYLGEITEDLDLLDEKAINDIETKCNNFLNKQITETIKFVQDKYGVDIFGFGNVIYKNDQKLWKKVSKDWDIIFPKLNVKVESDINIVNTATRKKE